MKQKTVALTRSPSATLEQCELTYLQREPILFSKAKRQHKDYIHALENCGVKVVVLPELPKFPDSVFVEDTALILDEIALLTSPNVPSRKKEVEKIKPAIETFFPVISAPDSIKIEGGDVLRIGKSLYVGISPRTNQAGIDWLRRELLPYNYQVFPVPLKGCLHLKTGCTALDLETLLINPNWIEPECFPKQKKIFVAAEEPFAGNVLALSQKILMSAENIATKVKVEKAGFEVIPVDISEFSKAEAGLTCMSLIFEKNVAYKLWRQDDLGNSFPVKTDSDYKALESEKKLYEAKGHKQHYWIEEDFMKRN